MLSDVAELVMGQSPPSTSYNDGGYGLPFYQGKTDFGATYPTPRIYCREPKKLAEAGDILMSVRAPVGATNICHGKSCIGRGIAAIRPKGIDRDFLYFYLKKIEAYVDSLGSGAIFKAINKSQLAELPINEAGIPLPEQKRIAHILSTVQRAIEAQERIIQTTTELKKTLMHKLFTEGTRGEPQKQTEIGLIPESWELISIEDLFETQLGKMLSRKSKVGDSPKPYLRNKNVQWGRIDTGDMLQMDFDDREMEKFQLRKGDLLVCEGGEVGRTALWDGSINECYYQKALHRLRPKTKQITNEYMAHWMMFAFLHTNTYGVTGTRTTIAHLPEIKLKPLLVPTPSPEEQKKIAQALAFIDKKITKARTKRVCLQDLFRTLLHELMTAKIRVDAVELYQPTLSGRK